MLRLLNDNTPELLKATGKTVGLVEIEGDSEFYSLLKTKLFSDIQKGLDRNDLKKKADAFIDAHVDLEEFMARLEGAFSLNGLNFSKYMDDRIKKLGGFGKRMVVKDEDQNKEEIDFNNEEIKEVTEFGEKHGYPQMVLERNETGIPFMTTGKGKDSWERLMECKRQEHKKVVFENLLDSVRKEDIYEEEGKQRGT